MTDSEMIIRRLYQITLDHSAGFAHQVSELLNLGRERFGLEIAILARIRGDEYTVLNSEVPQEIPIPAGTRFELGRTYCAKTVAENGPVGLVHVGDSALRTHPAYEDFKLESYLGTPVTVSGRIFGTLNFSSAVARSREFCDVDYDALKFMAAWLGGELGRIHREDQLRLAEERFRQALDVSPGAIIITEYSGAIIHANLKALELFDYSYEQIIGRSMDMLIPAAQRGQHHGDVGVQAADPEHRRRGEGPVLTARDSMGTEFPVEVALNPVEMTTGSFVLVAVTDLTERKRFEAKILAQSEELKEVNRKLAEQASVDSLTDLLNRRGLADRMEAIVSLAHRNGHHTSALMLDIDNFKEFNDTYGHHAGDEALVAVARTIKEMSRSSDLVCRYGGEEFLALLPETDATGALTLAERMRAAVADIPGLARPVTLSIGVASLNFMGNGSGLDEAGTDLLKRADAALYAAKEAGRDRVVYDMNASSAPPSVIATGP